MRLCFSHTSSQHEILFSKKRLIWHETRVLEHVRILREDGKVTRLKTAEIPFFIRAFNVEEEKRRAAKIMA